MKKPDRCPHCGETGIDYRNFKRHLYMYCVNEPSTELNELPSRGCCDECGEGLDNEEEWRYNTECEVCGEPIPDKLIIRSKEDDKKWSK